MEFDRSRFVVHGKQTLSMQPDLYEQEPVLRQTSPTPMMAGRARVLIETFLKERVSHHSGRAGTVWVLVEYCKAYNLHYCLTGTPAEGYLMELLD